MDSHCVICGAYLSDTGRMICEKCESLQQTDVRPCPRCGEVPHIGYACGEYFIIGATDGCPVCDGERRERCRWQVKRPERVAAVKISQANSEQEILGTATGQRRAENGKVY